MKKSERTIWSGNLVGGQTLMVTENTGRVEQDGTTVSEWAWVNYASGDWDGEKGTFDAVSIDGETEDLHLSFGRDTDLEVALILSDRIEASIVYQETALVTDAGWVRVFVRKNPDGSMFTQALGFNIDGAAPEKVEAVVNELEEAVREAVGMPIN